MSESELIILVGARTASNTQRTVYRGLETDDRRSAAGGGQLFVAVKGTEYDSHSKLERLEALGYAGVVGEAAPPPSLSIPYYRVSNSRLALSQLADAFAGYPSQKLETFGVTGTNGKTRCVALFQQILAGAGQPTGWIGTVDRWTGSERSASSLTTPGPQELARNLADACSHGLTHCVLEVSSHALDQHRVDPYGLAGALLTNVGRDHLDYHGTYENYLRAKLRIFELLSPGSPGVIAASLAECLDPSRLLGPIFTFDLDADASLDGAVEHVEYRRDGLSARLRLFGEPLELDSNLVGAHNLANLLGVSLLARAVGIESDVIQAAVQEFQPVAGRLEPIAGARGRVLVDYAHTPDALEAALRAVKASTPGETIVLFGCGGDRDRGKRAMMGQIAEELADRIYVTSDNPRTEDPERIIADICEGITTRDSVVTEVDRGAAIAQALETLGEEDSLVIAGKGHEKLQIIGTQRLPFDDREVVLNWLAERRLK